MRGDIANPLLMTTPPRRSLGRVHTTADSPPRRPQVKELIRYLLENMYLDFQGEISLDTVRQYLRGDESRESRILLQKLIEDKGVDELLLTLADVLKDHIRTGVSEEVVREQLSLYADS
jgi:hypothetical protein